MSSWIVVWGTVLTFICMLRYWMRNVVPRGLQWNCNEVLDVRCTSAEFCSPCGIYGRVSVAYAAYTADAPQSMRHIQPGIRNLCGIYGWVSAIHAAYTVGSPQSMRHIRLGLRSLCGIYDWAYAVYIIQQYILQKYPKFRWDIFRLSVELPVQKHTGTS